MPAQADLQEKLSDEIEAAHEAIDRAGILMPEDLSLVQRINNLVDWMNSTQTELDNLRRVMKK